MSVMEFARQGGIESPNRYNRGSYSRRGNRNTERYESYFDRQGDVRLQEGSSGVTSSSSNTRTFNRYESGPSHRPMRQEYQQGAGTYVPNDGPFQHGYQSQFRGDYRGRGGRGRIHRNTNDRGFSHGQRRWNDRGGYGTYGHPPFMQPETSPPYYPFMPPDQPFEEQRPRSSRSQSRETTENDTVTSSEIKMIQKPPQVLKREDPKGAAKSSHGNNDQEKINQQPNLKQGDGAEVKPKKELGNNTKDGFSKTRKKESRKADPQSQERSQERSQEFSSSNKSRGQKNGPMNQQRKSDNKRGNRGKITKQNEPVKDSSSEVQNKGKQQPTKSGPKLKIQTKTDGATTSFSQTKHTKGEQVEDAPMSPEEFESLKALEERLRELKQFGAEKYESQSKAAAQVLKTKQKVIAKYAPLDSEQAKNLVEQLIDGTYDCMVCCDRIRWTSPVWNCPNCYHIFHLPCINKWTDASAASGKDPDGWRCPACQNVNRNVPDKYKCFCGKVTNPEWKPRDGITPHSCGNVCKKSRMVAHCTHPCTELCHPGPCPSCPVMIAWHCPCGKKSYQIRCGQAVSRPCENSCDKVLKCGRHNCKEKCHQGPCNHCTDVIQLACFCGKRKTEEICGSDGMKKLKQLSLEKGEGTFSCTKLCGKTLSCGNHPCTKECHLGPCPECPLLPQYVTHCPCGKVEIKDLLGDGKERSSCLNPIPCCTNTCQKIMKCGTGGKPHYCKFACHTGSCGPCDGTSVVSCRCGSTKKEVPCAGDVKDRGFQCTKICKKKRTCGRHRCNTKCCVDDSHICTLVCGKKLQCGIHHCDELCHPGYCPRCWETSFEERSCHCGKTVQLPPIACGTPLPTCMYPCSREHDCEHTPQHNCNNDASCPPCPVLTKKTCMGGHEPRDSIPCHVKNFSCGRKCGNPLQCGHQCDKQCHKGGCLQNEKCRQSCPVPRRNCGHPCGTPCHSGEDCPNTSCNAQVTVTCPCGRRSTISSCKADNALKDNFSRFMSENMAEKMHALQSGQQIEIGLFKRSLDRLQCDEECAIAERNRRLADAFDIKDEEIRSLPRVAYSYFLQQEAGSNLAFVKMVEDTLEELAIKVKKLEQAQLSHSFPPMNSTQRRIVHELAAHYGCRTQSYDQEPRRNTVVIATKESRVPPNKLYSQFYQQGPPKPLVLTGSKSMDTQSFRLETLEKKTKKEAAPDYFGDHFQD